MLNSWITVFFNPLNPLLLWLYLLGAEALVDELDPSLECAPLQYIGVKVVLSSPSGAIKFSASLIIWSSPDIPSISSKVWFDLVWRAGVCLLGSPVFLLRFLIVIFAVWRGGISFSDPECQDPWCQDFTKIDANHRSRESLRLTQREGRVVLPALITLPIVF